MRLAISNIAWDVREDAAVVDLLRRLGIDAIDVAPGKYFPEPELATVDEIARVRTWWSDRGIEITGMQALLFGTSGLNVFGGPDVQRAMLRHLAAVCRIGAGLGGRRLVFGSPRNRDRSGLDDAQALERAVDFFRRLGDLAGDHGVVVCLEPNPVRYGANFMTGSVETLQVVQAVGHRSIRMQLDTGALAINGEDPLAIVEACAPFVGHVHLSEPDLVPIGDGGTDHKPAAIVLRRYLPGHVVTVEMLATASEPHLDAIARALSHAVLHYRDATPADARRAGEHGGDSAGGSE